MARPKADAGLEPNRRAELLRSAARLFVEQGFAATTTRDIAEAAGMRAGSPFYHFRSKQELLKAAMIEGLDTGRARLLAAVDGIDDPESRLRLLIRTHLGNLLEGDCRSPLLIYESRALEAADRAEVAAAFDRYQRPWQATLDDVAAQGKLASSAPPVRLLLFGMLNGCSHWYRADGPLSVDQVAEAALALLLCRAPAGTAAPLQVSPAS